MPQSVYHQGNGFPKDEYDTRRLYWEPIFLLQCWELLIQILEAHTLFLYPEHHFQIESTVLFSIFIGGFFNEESEKDEILCKNNSKIFSHVEMI